MKDMVRMFEEKKKGILLGVEYVEYGEEPVY
jgi:hypothetical protein